MDLDNQYFECADLIFILTPFQLCLYNKKFKNKMVVNQSIINGERYEEAKKVEKSEDVAEKNEDGRVQVER